MSDSVRPHRPQPTRLPHPWDSPGKNTGVGWGIGLDYCDIEWFALEMNRDHYFVLEIASKYCILESFVDHDGYSISSNGLLPTVVDIMVI